MAQAPAPIWQGLYIGADGGGLKYDYQTSATDGGLFNSSRSGTSNHTSAGLFGGYNWQSGHWVLGAEADWTRQFGKTTDRDFFSVRARGGYTVGNALFYATAGLGLEDVSRSVTYSTLAGVTSKVTIDNTHTGFVVGGGVEAMLMPHVFLRAEALYFNGSKENYDFPAVGGAPALFSDLQFNHLTYRAGISYLFN